MSSKFIKTIYRTGAVLLLLAALGVGASLYKSSKTLLMPGPLSEVAVKGQPLEGYSNHADFEQSCGHCHAPVHCITDTGCQDCHMDVARQLSTGEGLHARLPGTGRCQTCHIEHNGREVVLTEFSFANIDHTVLSGFSLDKHQLDYDGSHLSCESCHSQSRFMADTLDCITCHSQADHDYMAAHIETYGVSCTTCHDGLDSMAAFVHNEVYPLDGAHTETGCRECHAGLAFEGASSECSTCHEKTSPYATMFGTDCQRCHTTAAWAPALLTQHTFSLSHGSDEQLACESCHVEQYLVKTCYECHDHQPDEMQSAHLAEAVFVIDRCEECHPTGAAGEAERLRAQWEPLRASESAWIEGALQYNASLQDGGPLLPAQPEQSSGPSQPEIAAGPGTEAGAYLEYSGVELQEAGEAVNVPGDGSQQAGPDETPLEPPAEGSEPQGEGPYARRNLH
jgi:hypothetical protein